MKSLQTLLDPSLTEILGLLIVFRDFNALRVACRHLRGGVERNFRNLDARVKAEMLREVRVRHSWAKITIVLRRFSESLRQLGQRETIWCYLNHLASLHITPPCQPWIFESLQYCVRLVPLGAPLVVWARVEAEGQLLPKLLPKDWMVLELDHASSDNDLWVDFEFSVSPKPEVEHPENVMALMSEILEAAIAIVTN
jgi:hypothetical protein